MIWLLMAAALALHAIDWLQTRWISVHGAERGIYETNVFLGIAPSLKRVDGYFLATAIGLIALSCLLDALPAAVVLLFWAFVEIVCVVSNLRLGVKLYFGSEIKATKAWD